MRCTQEQFDAIKPKLKQIEGLEFSKSFDDFIKCPYLTNNFDDEELNVCNTNQISIHEYRRIVFEEWDENIFLKYCGYKPKVTLDDAYVVKCDNKQETNEVASFVKNIKTDFIHWHYVVNHKGLLNNNHYHVNLCSYIPDKAAHLPILTYQEWKQLKENKPMTKQKLTVPITDVLEIHKIACNSLKDKISLKYLIRTDENQNIEFKQYEINDMFKSATPEQLPVLERIFGKKVKEIDWDKIKTGSKVMIQYTGQHCGGINEIDLKKPVDVVFYKTNHCIHFIDNKFYIQNRINITFHQNGKYVLFAADENTDYITEVIEY